MILRHFALRPSRLATAALASVLFALSAGMAHGAPAAGAADDGAPARGVVRAVSEATLASAVSAPISRMPYKEGDRFAAGAALVVFDCGKLAAELEAARAGHAMESRAAQVQEELLKLDATGRADADIARAKAQEKAAQVSAIQQQMRGCTVSAPFSGRVVELLARAHETPPPNEKLIRIVSDRDLELHMVVPSKWLGGIRPGSLLDFVVDETGDRLKVRVQRISAAVDAVSQTVKIVGALQRPPATVLPGMSGQVRFDAAPAGAAAR